MSFHVISNNTYGGAYILDTSDMVCEFTTLGRILDHIRKGVVIEGVDMLVDYRSLPKGAIDIAKTFKLRNSPPEIKKTNFSRLSKGVHFVVKTISVLASEYDCQLDYYGDLLIVGLPALNTTSYCTRDNISEVSKNGYILLKDRSTHGVACNTFIYASSALRLNYSNPYEDIQIDEVFRAPYYAFPKIVKFETIRYDTNIGSTASPSMLGELLYKILQNGYIKGGY